MDKVMVLVTVEFVKADGTKGTSKFSEEFNTLMKPEEYAAYFQERTIDENSAATASTVSVEITKHNENGEYLLDEFGSRTWKKIYSANDQ
jgi:hypothetical protein